MSVLSSVRRNDNTITIRDYGRGIPLGKVEVQSGGTGDWVKAKPNFPVSEGDIIRTLAKSLAEITLIGGGKMRIGENSELVLNKASVKPMEKNFNASLNKGNIWVSAQADVPDSKMVKTH